MSVVATIQKTIINLGKECGWAQYLVPKKLAEDVSRHPRFDARWSRRWAESGAGHLLHSVS